MTTTVSEKSAHLLAAVDLERPELAVVKTQSDPAAAFVAWLAAMPRPRFRFEYERKPHLLAFLREHYAAWREFNTAPADRIAAMCIAEAQRDRALQDIAALGHAWWATDDPKYGAAFERFFVQTETGGMFTWAEFAGLQGSIDLDPYFLLIDCPAFTTAGRIAYLDHLHTITSEAWDTHTSQWQQLMLGPEGHNWYLHGMHVLPFFGLLFPEFKRSDFFLKVGWSVVEEHVRGHIKPDGGMRETSMDYQAFSMENLWDFYLLARRNGHPVSPGFESRLLDGTKFLLRLMAPDGCYPCFGDGYHTPGRLAGLAGTAAAIAGDGECKWYAEYCRAQCSGPAAETPGQLPLAAFWAVGLEGALAYARTRVRNPHHASVLMGSTGYAALRDGDGPAANYLAIAAADRGPIVTSHGHNDIFSLELHAGGQRFIGELDSASYGDSPGRAYEESTAAHSTLTIAGCEQVPIINEWRWAKAVIPQVRRWISEETHDFFHGVHEGFYLYPDHRTLHARKVFFIKQSPACWVVLDWIESDVEDPYRIYFHGCVPGKAEGTTLLFGEEQDMRLAVIPPAGDMLVVERVASDGLLAHIRERGVDPERHPCFAYGKQTASDCFVWVLNPLATGSPMPEVRRLPVMVNGLAEDAHGATAVEIARGGTTDVLCVSHKDFDAELAFGPHRAWGHLAFRRLAEDGTVILNIEHTMPDGVCGR